jgi:hypothetical protein
MPMPPEDIMTGLQTLAASDTMNPRQREVMTEASGMIKFQQHRVSEAERKQKHAEDEWDKIAEENKGIRARLSALLALDEYRRKQLMDLANTTEAGAASAEIQNPDPLPKKIAHPTTTVHIERTT